jgi:hypothetical protein
LRWFGSVFVPVSFVGGVAVAVVDVVDVIAMRDGDVTAVGLVQVVVPVVDDVLGGFTLIHVVLVGAVHVPVVGVVDVVGVLEGYVAAAGTVLVDVVGVGEMLRGRGSHVRRLRDRWMVLAGCLADGKDSEFGTSRHARINISQLMHIWYSCVRLVIMMGGRCRVGKGSPPLWGRTGGGSPEC